MSCPYCGESMRVMLDPTVPHQVYIEDCQVCCQPIVFDVSVDEGDGISVLVKSENE